MANSIDTRLTALEERNAAADAARAAGLERAQDPDEAFVKGADLRALTERLEAAEVKAKQQHGTIVALQTALKAKDK
jgi:hypothetical protein